MRIRARVGTMASVMARSHSRSGPKRLSTWHLPALLACLATSIFAQDGRADPCAEPMSEPPTPEGREQGQVVVDAGVFLLDLSHINDVSQHYESHLVVQLGWNDPRVAARVAAGCPPAESQLWTPPLGLVNQRGRMEEMARIIDYTPEGRVGARLRWAGLLSTRFDLHGFPFDAQKLPVILASYDDRNRVKLRIDSETTGAQLPFSAMGWTFQAPASRMDAVSTTFRGRELERLIYEIVAIRQPGFYLWKVVVPLCLIVLMSFAVFLIDPSEFGVQIQVSTASVLTLVAFQLSLDRFLPRVPYLTSMDVLTVGGLVLVFIALAEAMVTGWLARRGRADVGQRLDRISRVVFPLALLALLGAFAGGFGVGPGEP